jgi:energy-coupling factor transporter ATP-binding protein EcfA2
MDQVDKLGRIIAVNKAFTPSTPIDDRRLFADRPDQMMACLQTFSQKGRHIALFGERGVGKTSLANIIPEIVSSANIPSMKALRVDCNTNDNYNTIWKKVFRELETPIPESLESSRIPADPEEIRFILQRIPVQMLLVIDEFDRVENDEALSLLADTVKTLSDHGTSVTLMFVGVASSLTNLLGEHESIIRNVEQVPMPRMSGDEIRSTLERGFEAIPDLTLHPDACEQIINTTEGLPHYAHVLGLNSGLAAVQDDRDIVEVIDVRRAEAVVMKTHSMAHEYNEATNSPQPGHLFEEVLLACAYAPRDNVGHFRPSDIRAPLSKIVGRDMNYPNFQRHLTELSGEKRRALYKEGESRNWQFRFRDPLLQPFVKMVARSHGRIPEKILNELAATQAQMTAPDLLNLT